MTLLTDAPVSSALPGREPVRAHGAEAVAPAVVPEVPEVVVRISGALDLSTVARVRESLEEALGSRPPRLVVDLTECPFVDASALAMLIEAHRRMSRSGGVLTLRGSSPRVLRLLSLTGLRRVFDLS